MGEWKGTSGGSWVDFACAYLRTVPKRDVLGARMHNVFHNFWLLQGGIHHNKYFDGRWDGRWECGKQLVKLVTYTRTHTHTDDTTLQLFWWDVGLTRAFHTACGDIFPSIFLGRQTHTRESSWTTNIVCVCVFRSVCSVESATHSAHVSLAFPHTFTLTHIHTQAQLPFAS